jgi:hypothetical protein
MANDHRFQIEPPEYTDKQRRRSTFASCMIGCLVVAGVLLVVAIIFGVWVARNWRGWFADLGTQVVNQQIDESDLPPQEKVEIKVQVERVRTEFKAGRISMEQAVKIVENLAKSPLMPMLVVAAVDAQYFDKSGLRDEEKAEGRVTLQRFARAVVEGKIKEDGVDKVLSHIADRRGKDNWEPREHVSDADLRAALAEAKSQADAAGMPAEIESEIDPSDEFKKVIDEALAKPGAEAPAQN